MITARNTRSGFTLIEVMIVLLIVSGILVTISATLTAARAKRDTIHNLQENQLAGPAILDLIERDLRGIFIYNRPDKAVLRISHRVKAAGRDADNIDFITSTNAKIFLEEYPHPFADWCEVGYRLRPNPEDDDFLEIWRREGFGVDEEPFDDEEGRYTFLHDRVRGFDIKIFEEDDPEAEELESWGTDDDEFTGLPARIEIELVLENAPRLAREQIKVANVDKRVVTYRRIIRFPESLFLARQVNPVPTIPVLTPTNPVGGPGPTGPPDPDNPGGPVPALDPGSGGPIQGSNGIDFSTATGSGDAPVIPLDQALGVGSGGGG